MTGKGELCCPGGVRHDKENSLSDEYVKGRRKKVLKFRLVVRRNRPHVQRLNTAGPPHQIMWEMGL